MNRRQRRADKADARRTGKSPDSIAFVPTADETDEVHAFSVRLQEAVHEAIAEAGYHDVERRREMAPRVVHALGLTAASFAIVAGCTEAQLIEAMRVYYRQVQAQLAAIVEQAKADAEPRIIVP
jgi:hypothetical protein